MNDRTARLIGGLYIALTSALTDEGARLVHETLSALAEHPKTPADDRHVYRRLVECATRPIDEPGRPRFEIIQGGAA